METTKQEQIGEMGFEDDTEHADNLRECEGEIAAQAYIDTLHAEAAERAKQRQLIHWFATMAVVFAMVVAVKLMLDQDTLPLLAIIFGIGGMWLRESVRRHNV